MQKSIQKVIAWIAILFIILLPWYYWFSQKKRLRNFHVVYPGELYRSGKLSFDGLEQVIRENGIKCVVNMRVYENKDQLPDTEEEAFCQQLGVRYERMTYRSFHSLVEGQPIPADESVRQFLNLLDQRKEIGPILVHCIAGKHRTGAFVSIYRMEYNQWENAEAIREMQQFGYDNLESQEDIHSYMKNYKPRHKKAE